MREQNLTLCELADPGQNGHDGLESYSPFCLKVHRALRLAGLGYETRRGRSPADFKHLNAAGQVPVLLVGSEPVVDSTRILMRIDTLSGGALTGQLDARQQAQAWLWEDFADTVLNGFLASARWADEANWPVVKEALFGAAPWIVRRAIVPRIRAKVLAGLVTRDFMRSGASACWARFADTLDHLDTLAPEQDFWVGSSISVADLGLFGQLHALRTPLTLGQAQQLAQRKRLSAYLDRVDLATRNAPPLTVRLGSAVSADRERTILAS